MRIGDSVAYGAIFGDGILMRHGHFDIYLLFLHMACVCVCRVVECAVIIKSQCHGRIYCENVFIALLSFASNCSFDSVSSVVNGFNVCF